MCMCSNGPQTPPDGSVLCLLQGCEAWNPVGKSKRALYTGEVQPHDSTTVSDEPVSAYFTMLGLTEYNR